MGRCKDCADWHNQSWAGENVGHCLSGKHKDMGGIRLRSLDDDVVYINSTYFWTGA